MIVAASRVPRFTANDYDNAPLLVSARAVHRARVGRSSQSHLSLSSASFALYNAKQRSDLLPTRLEQRSTLESNVWFPHIHWTSYSSTGSEGVFCVRFLLSRASAKNYTNLIWQALVSRPISRKLRSRSRTLRHTRRLTLLARTSSSGSQIDVAAAEQVNMNFRTVRDWYG